MFNKKAKGLFFITACLVHIGASAMEVAEQQGPVEQVCPFPTLRHLCNKTLAPSLVEGVFYRSVDTVKIAQLESSSIIPWDLIPGLLCAAQEYRVEHPGILPIVSEAATSATNAVLNTDLLPNYNGYFHIAHDCHQRLGMLAPICYNVKNLSDTFLLVGVVGGFLLNDRQKNSKIWRSFESKRLNVRSLGRLCEIPTLYVPLAAYVVCKPTPRKIALGCASTALVGYGIYKGLKK